MEDRVIEAEADPIQAAIAETLESQAEWTVSDLADRLDLPDKMVRDGLVFWTGFGLVKEDKGGKWRLLEREE
jgi:anaphase-promoting complex subunit 2